MPSEQPDPESIDMVDTTSDAKGDTAGEKVGITEDTIRKAMEEFGVTDDERSQAFMRKILAELPKDKLEQLAAATPMDVQDKLEGFLGSKPKPCVLEGWWYEADQPTQDSEHIRRLLQIAKASGAACVKAGNWEEALEHYFSALEMCVRGDNELGTLHSNCSLMCLKLGRPEDALEHANTAVRIWPKWHKSHARRAAALEALGRLDEAADAYHEAQKHLNAKTDKAAMAEIRDALTRLDREVPRVEEITDEVPMCTGNGSGGASESVSKSAVPQGLDPPPHLDTPVDTAATWAANVRAQLEAEARDSDTSEEDEDVGEPLDEPQAFVPRNVQLCDPCGVPVGVTKVVAEPPAPVIAPASADAPSASELPTELAARARGPCNSPNIEASNPAEATAERNSNEEEESDDDSPRIVELD